MSTMRLVKNDRSQPTIIVRPERGDNLGKISEEVEDEDLI